MISRIRQSNTFKATCVTLALSILFEIIAPAQVLALTGGPSQPEFSSFTPIGASDMVDLSSGDMNYNIPLVDVGGYPVNLAYSGSVGMDDEASWVGLGWNLSVGQITRNVRGIPDDFNGDEIKYENYMKENVTVGATFRFSPNLTGVNLLSKLPPENETVSMSVGISAIYNNYSGFSIKPSVGITLELGKNASVGMNVESGPDGLTISPNLSLHAKSETKKERDVKTTGSVGLAYNTRQGLSAMTLSTSRKTKATQKAMGQKEESVGGPSIGSTISYVDQTYTPSKRVGMITSSFTVNAALGAEVFGGEGQGQITAFGTVMEVDPSEKSKILNAYGYSNTEQAGKKAIVDFNREKDGNFSVNSTNLPVTNYTYDIYSVQGQGVAGMYRPYRNQVGYVFDAEVQDGSSSNSLGVEIGTGNAFHLGVDFENTTINSRSGLWETNNYILGNLKESDTYNPNYEKVHYKNVGDLSVDRDFGMFNSIGSYHAVRVPYVGGKFDRKAKSEFRNKTSWSGAEGGIAVGNAIKRSKRQLRNQAIHNLTIQQIKDGVGYGPVAYGADTLHPSAKQHHTGEVQIVRNDGARYIYGLPAYNTVKKEATFAVNGTVDCNTGLVSYVPSALNNPTALPNDKYLNRVTTPAYVHTHLLTSVLSADYQDLTGNGPSQDDLGSYTKFTYKREKPIYKWRIPYHKNKANYNEGLKTESKDDQGNYLYGEKEQFYIDKIETKTHIAVFTTSYRHDAYGVDSEAGSDPGTVTGSKSRKLDNIKLYSVGEYYNENGTVNTGATPIKTVHFEYSYELCKGIPNNDGNANEGGKLTLKKVYFEYRNSKMGKYTPYEFQYNGPNPNYNMKGYDTWGNYLPNTGGCSITDLTAAEFPYTNQNKTQQNANAAAWLLTDIMLPSGGKIDIVYESDDYAYVQDKPVHQMFFVRGAGQTANPGDTDVTGVVSGLFKTGPVNTPMRYLYVQLENDASVTSDFSEIYNKYLSGLERELIYFRFLLNMTIQGGLESSSTGSDKYDYVTGYLEMDKQAVNDLKIVQKAGMKILVLPVRLVKKEDPLLNQYTNPIAKAGWHFGRKYLSNHVYSNQPNGDSEDIEAIVADMLSNITNLLEVFKGPNGALEHRNICRKFVTSKSWIRLLDGDRTKLGGGARVKEIKMTDMWATMDPGAETMSYGQQYNYNLESGLSSGVATYEPVGNKENPFVQPVFSTTEHLLAPDEENYMEAPFGESFFPSPQVTYSRVSVSTVQYGTPPSGMSNARVKTLHKTGKVVTEFYTSKDYPTIVDQTRLELEEDKSNALSNILNLKTRKHITGSQGYVIHLNDMNGKQKSQRVYAEGQQTPISGVDYIYDNHTTPAGYSARSATGMNQGKLNNLVKVINPNGSIQMKTIGVETDIINDFRENRTVSEVAGINANLATFFIGIIPGIVPVPLPDFSKSEEQFRSVSTTKVINTFGLLKETVVYDAGARVATRNLAWDATTGEVLVTETIDEFNDKYYTLNYPAHWYYRGMAQASQNLGLKGKLNALGGGSFSMSDLPAGLSSSNYLIPGDELVVDNQVYWITSMQGNNFKLVDKNGTPAGLAGGSAFFVLRSGHRNLQSAGIMNVVLKHNPLKGANGTDLSSISPTYLNTALSGNHWKVINAGAVDYSDYWTVGCECGINTLEGVYNPYFRNERGVWRVKSSRTYLSGRDYHAEVTPRIDGYMSKFSPMYKIFAGGYWAKDTTNWTFVSEVTRYSPYGFELENKDALNRHSAAQYGYNHNFPMAVGANTAYRQIGYDGFEDYHFSGCSSNAHFNFKDVVPIESVTKEQAHTGKYSLKVGGNSIVTLTKILSCGE